MVAATLRTYGPGQRSSEPSVAFLVFSPVCALLLASSPSEARGAHPCGLFHLLNHEQEQLLQSRAVAGQHSVEAGLESRLERMGRLHNSRCTCAESRADFRRARDDGLAQDAGSPAADDSHRPAALPEDALRTICGKNIGRRCLRAHGGR